MFPASTFCLTSSSLTLMISNPSALSMFCLIIAPVPSVDLYYKIAIHEREKVKAAMELAHSSQKMSRAYAKSFFKKQLLSDANIYRYLSPDDYDYLKSRWPEDYTLNPITDEKNSRWLLDMMDARPDCDWKLFSNYIKAIVTVTMHPENLHQDIYEETILLMIDGLVGYVFG
jgi:hypothetical protein